MRLKNGIEESLQNIYDIEENVKITKKFQTFYIKLFYFKYLLGRNFV